MSFGDLSTRAGVQALNNFLADKSYIEGFTPSSVDSEIFELVKTAPAGDLFHALRWFNHINSFAEAERKAFRASSKKVSDFTGAAAAAAPAAGGDDEIDLFGSDEEEESEEAKRVREERLAMYAAKKDKKPALVAKSCVTLGISPWDDETDLDKMEELVRGVQMEGLVWGAIKRVPVAYGLSKLSASCVIEDDKVSTIDLEEQIAAFEDYVQSVDIITFNKL